MSDLDHHLRDYAAHLEAAASPVTTDELRLRLPVAAHRRRFLAAAAVILVAAALTGALHALRDDRSEVTAGGSVSGTVLFYADAGSIVRHDLGTGNERRVALPHTTTVLKLLVVDDTLFALAGSTDNAGRVISEAVAVDLDLTGAPRSLGPSQILVPSLNRGRVWLWDGNWDGELREVDSHGTMTATTPAPSGFPFAAVPGGFVIDLPNYHLGVWDTAREGSRPLAAEPGRSSDQLVAVHDGTIIWLGCDDSAPVPCGLHVTEADGSRRTIVMEWNHENWSAGAVTTTGDTLAVITSEATPRLILVDLRLGRVLSQQVLTVEERPAPGGLGDQPELRWVANDRCIAWTSGSGTSVTCPGDESQGSVGTPPRTPIAGL